ncbi:Eukaryotic initiation factor 1A [Strongyloides ratti]|uniref:Eukaryotic initiation factor 1A n=1 Tax=Strongyloides ratti TaxID=34506 RepID=A0A090MXD8_STRRB|nr:Eukaryotic initiation factor 1A [Strongyloides ratti]CEF65259.1 Eukaryotic initiation factor 1A [Strongyloides ratti]
MPKNKGKGGKNRRRGKNESDVMKRELIKKDSDDQEYAQVLKMLGNGRLIAFCFDGKERLCHIRVGLRDYQDSKADVILKYTPDEARVLKSEGHLPEAAKLNEAGDEIEEADVEFADIGGHDDEDKDAGEDSDDLKSSDDDEESEEESDSEAESSGDDSSDMNEEQLAGRNWTKPGARDRYGKANKGKRYK